MIYARISSDDGTALGVERQVKDCRAEAEKRGWDVGEVFIDNDISASNGKRRPAFEKMLSAIEGGSTGALVVWDVDRLTRTPAELEDFISLCDRASISLASVGGEIDLATPQGRLTARIKGSVARHEVEQSSRRLRAKFLQRAEQGAPHGKEAYGYKRIAILDEEGRNVGARDEINLAEADVVRETTKRLLAGESLRAIVKSLNAREIPSPRGNRWESATLKQVILRERNVGNRVHQGKVIGRGNWDPILEDGEFERVKAMLADPNRRTSRGVERIYVLSGIALCGLCGGQIRGSAAHMTGTKTTPAQYSCKECYRIRRKMSLVDEVVEGAVVARLSRPDGPDLFAGDPDAARKAREQVAEITAKLENLADDFAEDKITEAEWRRFTAKLRPRLSAAKARLDAARPLSDLQHVTEGDVAALWPDLPVETRTAAVDALMTVTIMPAGAGRAFDPELIRIEWKS